MPEHARCVFLTQRSEHAVELFSADISPIIRPQGEAPDFDGVQIAKKALSVRSICDFSGLTAAAPLFPSKNRYALTVYSISVTIFSTTKQNFFDF